MASANEDSYRGTNQPPRFQAAYERLLPEIQQVPESRLVTINIDIPQAVITALGVWRNIKALRTQIIAASPQFDIANFDNLEAYTLATGHAHTSYLTANSSTEKLRQLVKDAVALRNLLYTDALALGKRGLINTQALKNLKGPRGFLNSAFDLLELATLIRRNWEQVSGRTGIQLQDLDTAEALGERLIADLGLREHGPNATAEPAKIRQQAFTLFVNAYDQVRRAIVFLRWNERDADKIAPSLYANRKSAKANKREAAKAAASAVPSPTVETQSRLMSSHNGDAQLAASATPVGDTQPFLQ